LKPKDHGDIAQNQRKIEPTETPSNAHQVVIPTLGWIKEMKLETDVLESKDGIQNWATYPE
jgi:hypothetical protein